jgi:hypothetical protein
MREYDGAKENKEIKKSSGHLPVARVVAIAGLVLLLCAVGLTACGGGGGKANPEKTEIGKMLQAKGWEVTLTGLPEKQTVVGTGGTTSQAKGIYAIVYLRVINRNKDILLFPPSLVKLRDSQGREFEPTGSTVQFAYLQSQSKLDLLIDSPVKAGDTRETFLIYDIPTDAKDLVLIMEGVNDTIELGL